MPPYYGMQNASKAGGVEGLGTRLHATCSLQPSHRLEGRARGRMANIRVRWEGNGSPRYDGKMQDVAVKWVQGGRGRPGGREDGAGQVGKVWADMAGDGGGLTSINDRGQEC